ncbi:hypothetical protein WICMUC_002870 [Wickerhamomyces mucosus]|uniref:Nitrogen regulatory protein areA GATA-like domain-containing protein n=1 Tax=Wickerhamomyces mucosus TaxID=1378264 RepID=A0A9P8PMU6_9ASCO|nr:hypothetical protein WICMUC_002870 [Wickerhamomyces mucosus]
MNSFDDQYAFINKHQQTSNVNEKFSGIDYFQFEFTELEIHNCWKLVASTNRLKLNTYHIPESTNIDRLENISWRKWGKLRSKLKEIDPKTLNWYKECDITWLYGPLVTSNKNIFDDTAPEQLSSSSIQIALSAAQSINTPKSRNESTNTNMSSLDTYSSNIGDSLDPYSSSSSSSLFDSESAYDTDSDIDEYDAEVKSILKDTNGKFHISEKKKKIHKSVSFAAMVQIRQF